MRNDDICASQPETKDRVLMLDADTERATDISPSLLASAGLERDDVIGKRVDELALLGSLPKLSQLLSNLRRHEFVGCGEVTLQDTSGLSVRMEVVGTLCGDGNHTAIRFSFSDVATRHERERLRSVDEKELLVREIHHRVKNNLQVIVSLMSLQAEYTKDPMALAALEDMEGRVRAMAHIHETRYATPDLAQIEFSAYLTNLVDELVALHVTTASNIQIDLKAEEMVLHMEQAIPLGLIANELIVNSLKHGLPGGGGKLFVALTYQRGTDNQRPGELLDEGWAQLEVADSGPGLSESADWMKARSMGFRLLKLLTKQLRGTVALLPKPGARICVEFPLALQ